MPVRPLPARPGGPPIWIGGLSEPAIRRAGRLADGFMATEVTPDVARGAGRRSRGACAPAPRTDRSRSPCTCRRSRGTATMRGSSSAPHHWYVTWKYDDMDACAHRAGEPPSPPEIDAALDASLREQIVMGTPEEVAERIRELADAAGGDLHYIARLYFPGIAPDVQREAMRVFAEEVAPALR